MVIAFLLRNPSEPKILRQVRSAVAIPSCSPRAKSPRWVLPALPSHGASRFPGLSRGRDGAPRAARLGPSPQLRSRQIYPDGGLWEREVAHRPRGIAAPRNEFWHLQTERVVQSPCVQPGSLGTGGGSLAAARLRAPPSAAGKRSGAVPALPWAAHLPAALQPQPQPSRLSAQLPRENPDLLFNPQPPTQPEGANVPGKVPRGSAAPDFFDPREFTGWGIHLKTQTGEEMIPLSAKNLKD